MSDKPNWKLIEEFDNAVIEFTDYFSAEMPDNSPFRQYQPSRFERIAATRQSMLSDKSPGFATIEEKTKAMRDEVAGWKRIKSLPKEQAEKELGYPIVGNWGS